MISTETIMDTILADNLALHVNTPAQAETLLHSSMRHWSLCELR